MSRPAIICLVIAAAAPICAAQKIESYRTLNNCPFRTIADVDLDNQMEVLEHVGTSVNVYHLRDHAPDPLPGWPRHVSGERFGTHFRTRVPPAAGEVRPGRPGLEIVVVSTAYASSGCRDRLHVSLFAADGARLFDTELHCAVGFAVALADLDSDGNDEILVAGERDSRGVVFALEDDGRMIPGWPWVQERSDSYIESTSLAVGNVYGDASPEVVFASLRWHETQSFVYVLDHSGQTISRWQTPEGEDTVHRVVLANVDDTPLHEVLILTRRVSLGLGVLHAIDSTGREVFATEPLAPFTWGPLVDDLDGDGRPEIVVASAQPPRVHVFDHTGNLARVFDGIAGEMSLADVDADGIVDITLCSPASPKKEARIRALSWDTGDAPADWPINPPRMDRAAEFHQPSIGDVDGDGLLELLLGRIVVELPTPSEGTRLPWPMFMKDARHTGSAP